MFTAQKRLFRAGELVRGDEAVAAVAVVVVVIIIISMPAGKTGVVLELLLVWCACSKSRMFPIATKPPVSAVREEIIQSLLRPHPHR